LMDARTFVWNQVGIKTGCTEDVRKAGVFPSNALANEHIGLEPVDDGIWSIVCYRTLLRRTDGRTGEITDAMV